MLIRIGNGLYFITISIFILTLFILCFILKDCHSKTQKRVLLIISFVNFAFHFLKILFPPYSSFIVTGAANTWPYSIANITIENVCALNSLLLPFALLSKKQWFKDSAFILAIIGGIAALVYPVDLFNINFPLFEFSRYYFCHYVLVIIPVLSLLLGLHKFSFKSFWVLPIFFFVEESVILLNNYLLMEIGVYPLREDFLNYEWNNTSFLYGPYFDNSNASLGFIDALVPSFMKKVPEGFTYYSSVIGNNYNYGGQEKYWPLLWMICPLIVYGYPLSFIVSFGLDYPGFKTICKKVKAHV